MTPELFYGWTKDVAFCLGQNSLERAKMKDVSDEDIQEITKPRFTL